MSIRFAWDESELLMRATARVERDRGGGDWRWKGTAFFVSERTLLTCAHVVAADDTLRIVWHDGERRHELPVGIRSRHPDLAAADPYPGPDVAVLDIADAVDVPAHPTAWLDDAEPGEHLWAFGYTDEYRVGMALGHPARFNKAGRAYSDDDGGEVWMLLADRIKGGMSGAPVLDLETGRVVAMLKRTRDSVKDIGGWATGMDEILAALPTVRDANDAANPQGRQLRLAEELWGELLWEAAAPLERSATARAAVARQLGLAEKELVGDDVAQALRLARELFVADLDVVMRCVTRLKRILDPASALKIFEAVVFCTRYEGEPWVTPASAAELDQQVALLALDDDPTGRVLQIRSDLRELCDAYRKRGDQHLRWWASLSPTPFSHLTDDNSKLPADLETELRIRTADKGGVPWKRFSRVRLDAATRAEWEKERATLVAVLRENGVVGVLPCDRVDVEFVDALVGRYPLVFLLATAEDPAPEVADHAAYQVLAPGIEDRRAEKALNKYSAMCAELGGNP